MDGLAQALRASNQWLGDDSPESLILSLLLSFVLGQALAWLYSWTHSGMSYSQGFTQSLVLLTLVVSIVMFVIGNSIVTAFGLLGALAIIRFRNVLKDTRDTVFVFFALVLGMAIGSQRYLTALLGIVAFVMVVLYLRLTSFGSQGRYDGHLTLQVDDGNQAAAVELAHKYCRSTRQMSKHRSGAGEVAEVVYQVRLRDKSRSGEMMNALSQLDGVRGSSLVLRDELAEM